MLKYLSIKKYGDKLLKKLEKKFGKKSFYTRSEIRGTVYKGNFSPTYLPLGYILYLEPQELPNVIGCEFPDVDMLEYKEEILKYLDKKSYQGSILQLAPNA